MLAQSVLIAWILVSIAMFAVLKPLRAFLLTYIIGLLFLPVEAGPRDAAQGAIIFSQSVRIEKFVACNIGAMLGTLMFASHVMRRYKFHWMDAAFLGLAVGHFLTSVVNGFGPKDGLSVAFEEIRKYVPLVILTRMYLSTVNDLYQAMRAIVGAGFVYSAICVLEWRFSPQLHRLAYGYAQHDFIQHMREGHFRAMGFLRHGIEVSTFMGMATAMAAWLWYKKLFKPLWGLVPIEAVLAALGIGLLSTMTVSGIAGMLLAVSMLALFVMFRSRHVLIILPVAAALWMGARYTETLSERTILRSAGWFVGADRLESLRYRLDSEEVNLSRMSGHLALGRSPQDAVLVDKEGRYRAIDAWWLIEITFFGLAGVGCWFLIWCSSIFETWRRWRRLTPDLQMLGTLVGIVLGVQFIDFLFNNFPSMFLMMLNVGMVSTLQHFVPAAARRRVTVRQQQAPPAPGASSPEVAMP